MATSIKHLARSVGADERTLRRAVQRGMVRCSRLSARRIAVREEEKRYLVEHGEVLARLRAALRTEANVRFAAVFGSTARGDARPESDVDLLVDLREDEWERRHRLVTRLERALQRPVDVVVLARVRRDNPGLVAEALREGRVLVDRGDVWTALKRSEPAVRRAARAQDARQAQAARVALEELLSA